MARGIALPTGALAAGIAHLRESDRLIARLIDKHPAPPHPRGGRKPFNALISAICNQQISRSAATAIEGRLAELGGSPYSAERLAACSAQQLAAVGLSRSKCAAVAAASGAACSGELDARKLVRMDDAQLESYICSLRGAGPWTAHMVMIFGLGRPDVMPLGDGAIVRAGARLLRIDEPARAAEALGRRAHARWRPHRTLAAWYLWRSLRDPAPAGA